MLAAPTGRAAKRMSEATGHEAKTIHRMLEFNMSKADLKRMKNPRSIVIYLIVDEASMIDTLLMHHLLKSDSSHLNIYYGWRRESAPFCRRWQCSERYH